MLSATWDAAFPPKAFPVLGSPKLDGFRALVVDGAGVTRSLKPIKNDIMRGVLSNLSWTDGELIVGDPTEPGCLRRTSSGVTKKDADVDWRYYVFDTCNPLHTALPFQERLRIAELSALAALHMRVMAWPHKRLHSLEEIFGYEEECVNAGYEGLMIRDPNGPYKWGRATNKEGWLTKMKRWEDAEAIIISVYEQEENQNAQTTNLLGRSQRSSHKANKVGKGRLGGYKCKTYWGGGGPTLGFFALDGCVDLDPVLFDCGAAANTTEAELEHLWNVRDHLPGQILKFKYQHRRGADRPSHPVAMMLRADE